MKIQHVEKQFGRLFGVAFNALQQVFQLIGAEPFIVLNDIQKPHVVGGMMCTAIMQAGRLSRAGIK